MDNGLLFAFDAYQVHVLSFCLLPSLYLHVSIVFVDVSVCARVELEIDIPGNTYKLISVYGHLLHFILPVSLYDRKICLLSLHQAYGSVEINKQNHSWNSLAKGFQLIGLFGQ